MVSFTEVLCATENSASFLMASPTFSFPMPKEFAGCMWLFWPHSVLQQWFLSRFLLFMHCQNYSLLHLPLSFRFSQRAHQSVWRMKEILPQLLLWPDFCQTYPFLGEDLPVWWRLTFMPCRSNICGIAFNNCIFGWSVSCFPCLSFSVVKFLAIIVWFFVAIQERFYFGDNILPCFESGIPLLKRRLQDLPDSDNVRISPIFISSLSGCVSCIVLYLLFWFISCACEFW